MRTEAQRFFDEIEAQRHAPRLGPSPVQAAQYARVCAVLRAATGALTARTIASDETAPILEITGGGVAFRERWHDDGHDPRAAVPDAPGARAQHERVCHILYFARGPVACEPKPSPDSSGVPCLLLTFRDGSAWAEGWADGPHGPACGPV